jgi:hypothetical protein
MEGLDLLFDGITVQHAGELLLNEPVDTWPVRGACCKSYRRSLEDFAFGTIFCREIVTMDSLPRVLRALPGEHLLTQSFREKHDRRLTTFPEKTARISPAERGEGDALKDLVRSLRHVPQDERDYWKQHMVREVFLYLGQDDSLRLPGLDGHYKYDLQDRQFTRDEELQRLVPNSYVSSVLRTVRGDLWRLHRGVQIACDDALREFVTLDVVEHLRIYDRRGRQRDRLLDRESSVWLPHCTRQSLVRVQERERDTLFDRIQDLVMPGLLDRMIAKSAKCRDRRQRRKELRKRLVDASFDPEYQGFRDALAEGLRLAAARDWTALSDLQSGLQERLSEWGRVRRWVWSLAIGRWGSAYERGLAKLIRAGAGLRARREEWGKVFPELLGEQRGRRLILVM